MKQTLVESKKVEECVFDATQQLATRLHKINKDFGFNLTNYSW